MIRSFDCELELALIQLSFFHQLGKSMEQNRPGLNAISLQFYNKEYIGSFSAQ